MGLLVRIDARRDDQHVVGEALEGVLHALGGLLRGIEELHRRAVRRLFLRPHIGEKRTADHFLRALDRRGCDLADIGAGRAALCGSADQCADTEQHRYDRRGLRVGEIELDQVDLGVELLLELERLQRDIGGAIELVVLQLPIEA